MVLVLYQSCKNAFQMLEKLNCQLLCIIISTDEHFVSRLMLALHSFMPSFLAMQSKTIFQLHISFMVSPKTQNHSSSCGVPFLKYYLGGKVGTSEL